LARKTTPFELIRPGILMAQRVAEANMMLALRMWGMAAAWKMAVAEGRRTEAACVDAPQAPARPLARAEMPSDTAPGRPRAAARAGRSRRAAGGSQ
jgi:hypothetical protein